MSIRTLWRSFKRWFGYDRTPEPTPIRVVVPHPPVIPSVTTPPPVEAKPIEPPSSRVKKFMRTNMAGIILITRFEGFYPDPYRCPANVPTIGYGTIYYPSGARVTMSDPPCTEAQAREWLASELKEKEDYINTWLIAKNITLTPNEFSAIISFAYNLGSGRVTKGSVSKALITGDMNKVAAAMMRFNKARNKWGVLRELRGLTRRRIAEVALLRME